MASDPPSPSTQRPTRFVLLGAGASVDAGLPTSVGLTARIEERLADDSLASEFRLLQAYRYAVGGLIWGAARSGRSPLLSPDVEAVVAAIRMLADRTNLPLAPFVAWDETLGVLEAPLSDRHRGETDLRWALEELLRDEYGRGSFLASRDLAEAIRRITEIGDPHPVFESLETAVLDKLAGILWIHDPSETEYLQPLLVDATVAGIATLNYDNTIELAAGSAGVPISTGVSTGPASAPPVFADGMKPLIKLHGSLDWRIQNVSVNGLVQQQIEILADPADMAFTERGARALVFGAGAKLQADGPFLGLFRAFRDRLDTVNHLTVVGYSLRDPHINHVMEEWLSESPDRSITFINRSELQDGWQSTLETRLAKLSTEPSARVRQVTSEAKTAIPRLFGDAV